MPDRSNSDFLSAKRHAIQPQSFGGKFLLLSKSHNQTSLADVEYKAEKIVFMAQEKYSENA